MAHGGNLCSICLDLVVLNSGRAAARLTCSHIFHLNCIGNAFNTGRRMQCPNCRAVEQDEWVIPLPEDNELDEDEIPIPQGEQMRRSFEERSLDLMQRQLDNQGEQLHLLRHIMDDQAMMYRMLESRQEGPQVPSGFVLYPAVPPPWNGELPLLSPPRSRTRPTPYDRPSISRVMEAGSSSRVTQFDLNEVDMEVVPAEVVPVEVVPAEVVPILPHSNQLSGSKHALHPADAGNMEAGSSRVPQVLNLNEADTEAVPTEAVPTLPHSNQPSDSEHGP